MSSAHFAEAEYERRLAVSERLCNEGPYERPSAESVRRHLRNAWLWWRAKGKPNPGCTRGGCAHPCPHPLRGLCYVDAEDYWRKAAVGDKRREIEARRRSWMDAANRGLPTARLRFQEYLDAKKDLQLIDGPGGADG